MTFERANTYMLDRCLSTSNISTDPATAALSDSVLPSIGMLTSHSASSRAGMLAPAASPPTTSASGGLKSASWAIQGSLRSR